MKLYFKISSLPISVLVNVNSICTGQKSWCCFWLLFFPHLLPNGQQILLVLSSNILRINPLLTVSPSSHFLQTLSSLIQILQWLPHWSPCFFPFLLRSVLNAAMARVLLKCQLAFPTAQSPPKVLLSHTELSTGSLRFLSGPLSTHTPFSVYSIPAMLTLMFLSHASCSYLGPLYSLCVFL